MTLLHASKRKALIGIAVLGLLTFGGTVYRIVAAGGAQGTATSTSNNLRQPVANTNGLIAWYPLDGDSKDYSGNHNDGTPTNFTYDGTTNGWTGGKFGKALLLSPGLKTYVNAPTQNYLNTFPLTASAWVKFSGGSCGSECGIVTKYSSGTNNGFNLYIAAANQLCSWYFRDSSDSIYGSNAGMCSPKAVSDGLWHNVVFVVDASGGKLYVDSNAVVSLAWTGTPGAPNTSTGLSVGYYNGTASGSIDDVRIYNRALSASEVGSLYAGSPSQNCDQTCKVWLKFDDNTGTSASDSVGSHFGTLNGASAWTTGNFASAVALDGSTGYVSVPDLGMTAGTVDMWINSASVSGDQRLFSQASGAATQAGQLALNQSSGENGSLWVWDGSAWQRLSPDGTVKPGQWNQIVVSNNGGTATAYINGTQQLTAAAAFNFSGIAANIGGKFLGTTGGTFNGSVDDFRVYSRMLAPEEVAEQWRQGT